MQKNPVNVYYLYWGGSQYQSQIITQLAAAVQAARNAEADLEEYGLETLVDSPDFFTGIIRNVVEELTGNGR